MRRLFEFALFVNLTVSSMSIYAQTTGEPTTPPGSINNDLAQAPLAKCLPPDVQLSDVVDASPAGHIKAQPVGSPNVTVEQKLTELKATCNSDNKLVDGNGKQIVFYHLTGCWGNPPADYQEILQKQQEELNKLNQQYTVIEISCNPSGIRIS
jgi:hypothetical protein